MSGAGPRRAPRGAAPGPTREGGRAADEWRESLRRIVGPGSGPLYQTLGLLARQHRTQVVLARRSVSVTCSSSASVAFDCPHCAVRFR